MLPALNNWTSLYRLLKQLALPMHFYRLPPRAESLAFDGDLPDRDGNFNDDEVLGAGDSNTFVEKVLKIWPRALLNGYIVL